MDILMLPPIDVPPSVNEAYLDRPQFRKGFFGSAIRNHAELYKWTYSQRMKSPVAKAYCQEVSSLLNDQGLTTTIRDFIESHLFIDLELSLFKSNWIKADGTAAKNAGDADNRLKVLQDCIFDTVGLNDAVVFRVTSSKVPCSATHPYCNKVIVTFKPLSVGYDYL